MLSWMLSGKLGVIRQFQLTLFSIHKEFTRTQPIVGREHLYYKIKWKFKEKINFKKSFIIKNNVTGTF